MAFFPFSAPSPSPPPLLQTSRCLLFRSQIVRLHLDSHPRHRRILRPSAAARELAAVEKDEESSTPLPKEAVAASVRVLKAAAETRKVPAAEVLSALAVIKKEKSDPSSFLETLGGKESPGRTWMLIFTAQLNYGRLQKGQYFPLTAVQRFDAAVRPEEFMWKLNRQEELRMAYIWDPLDVLTFEGKFSCKNRILAFVFENIRIKLGPFNPLQINLGQADKEPSTKGPFFIWFYIDEEIAVAQGRGGGIAYWCRCRRIK